MPKKRAKKKVTELPKRRKPSAAAQVAKRREAAQRKEAKRREAARIAAVVRDVRKALAEKRRTEAAERQKRSEAAKQGVKVRKWRKANRDLIGEPRPWLTAIADADPAGWRDFVQSSEHLLGWTARRIRDELYSPKAARRMAKAGGYAR